MIYTSFLTRITPRWLRRGPPWAILFAAGKLRELLEQRLAYAARLQAPSDEQPPDVWDALALERQTAVSEFGSGAAVSTLRKALQLRMYRGSGYALSTLLLSYFQGTTVMIDVISNNGWRFRVNAATNQIWARHRGEVFLWPFTVPGIPSDHARCVIAINAVSTGGGSTPLPYDRKKIFTLVKHWIPEHMKCTVIFCYGPIRPFDYYVNPSASTNYPSWASFGSYTMAEYSAAEMVIA